MSGLKNVFLGFNWGGRSPSMTVVNVSSGRPHNSDTCDVWALVPEYVRQLKALGEDTRVIEELAIRHVFDD